MREFEPKHRDPYPGDSAVRSLVYDLTWAPGQVEHIDTTDEVDFDCPFSLFKPPTLLSPAEAFAVQGNEYQYIRGIDPSGDRTSAHVLAKYREGEQITELIRDGYSFAILLKRLEGKVEVILMEEPFDVSGVQEFLEDSVKNFYRILDKG